MVSLRILMLIFVSSIIWSGCTRNSSIGTVGSRTIESKDVEYRNKIARVYDANEKRDVGAQQLLRAFLSAQVLENNNHPVSDQVLEQEAKRIETTTQAPEKLAEIQAIFRSDRAAYLRVFVLPVYVERVIYFEFFNNSVDIHRESYERARSLLEKFAAVPAHFEKTSSEHGLSTFRFWVSLEHGPRVLFAKDEKPTSQTPKLAHQVKVQAHLQQVNSEQERNLGRKWTDEIALPLKIGQVSPQVINDQDSWLLVRLIRHTDSKFEFSGVRIPKRDYQEWRKHEDAKVKIEMRQSL